MAWQTVILVFVVMWWLSFFVVLPFGQISQEEAGKVEPGTVASAPVGLNWRKKIVITTVIGAILTATAYSIVTWDLFGFTS